MAVTLVIAWSQEHILEFRRCKDLRQGRMVADDLYKRYPYASRFSLYEEIDAYAAPKSEAYPARSAESEVES